MNGRQVRPFGLRDKIGYLFGDSRNDFAFTFASTLLMVFYMKVLGIPGVVMGTLFLVAGVVDAFRNTTVGRIVDVCRPGKDGGFKQWIRHMTGPMTIASFLMYQSFLAGASVTVKIVYTYVTHLLWGSVCYTVISIPYSSVVSAIADKPDERTGLSTFRGIRVSPAQLVIDVLGPVIIYAMDESGAQVIRSNGHTFPVIAAVLSLCAIVRYMICYKRTTEQVKTGKNPDAPKITLTKTFKTTFSGRAILGIIGAALFLMLSQLLVSDLNNYLYTDYFGDIKTFSSYTPINIILSLILAVSVGSITGRMGKKEAAVAATAFVDAVYLVLFFSELINSRAYVISAVVGFLGVNFSSLVIWANTTGVIDDTEAMTGKREDRTTYSVCSFAKKVEQALAGSLGGYTLEMIEYQLVDKVQNPQALSGLYAISTLVPALLLFYVTIMLLVAYPLNKKKVERNFLVLRERRAGK